MAEGTENQDFHAGLLSGTEIQPPDWEISALTCSERPRISTGPKELEPQRAGDRSRHVCIEIRDLKDIWDMAGSKKREHFPHYSLSSPILLPAGTSLPTGQEKAKTLSRLILTSLVLRTVSTFHTQIQDN